MSISSSAATKTKEACIGEFDALISLPKQEDLRALLVEQTLNCIRIKNVVPKEQALILSKNAIDKSRNHDRLEGLAITGNTHYQASQGGKLADEYFSSPETFPLWVRQNAGGVSPLDAVLGLFVRMHQKGIAPAALDDKREMPASILRVYPAAKCTEVFPHQDILDWDVDSAIAQELDGQSGWNVYLDMPSQGGELVLYDLSLDQEEYAQRSGNSYGLTWQDAGMPIATIRPEIGELILIDTHRIHAVKAANGEGHRVTLSGFLGYSEEKGLMSWA